MKYFIFSDPHGDYHALIDSLHMNQFDMYNKDHQLIGLGDYFGRAARSKDDCLNMWQYLSSDAFANKPILLRGNHESILIKAIKRGTLTLTDIYNGEHNTFASFMGLYPRDFMNTDYDVQRITAKRMIDIGFLKWLESLPWYYESKYGIFVHGFVPLEHFTRNIPLSKFKDEDWNRASWVNTIEKIKALDRLKVSHKPIVFGHWRAKQLIEEFLHEWNEDDGDIYIDKDRNLIGLDCTTVISHSVGVLVVEEN